MLITSRSYMKKKILHISCGGLGHGGVSSVIFAITEPNKDKFDFDCVVFKKKCEQEDRFLEYGRLHRIDAYSVDGKRDLVEIIRRPFTMFWGIYKLCKKGKYDVVHAHNNDEEAICLLAARLAGVPLRIAHAHATKSPQKVGYIKRCMQMFNQKMIRYAANKYVGCSREACRDYFGDADAQVIYNAVDLETHNIANKCPHKGIQFIHVGRYTYAKNQEYIIKVFKYIHNVLPEAKLWLIGFGEDENKLSSMIRENDLLDCCELIPGNSVNIPDYYAKADYMIFPSRFEGFGIVLLEAQAMGVECFVSEAIQKEVDLNLLHYLSLKDEPQKWADYIIEQIMNKKGQRKQLSVMRLQEYSMQTISQKYEELYNTK